jgi:hypothetical protein
MSVYKAAISVSEMASKVSLSRQRFYQLIGTAFPYPLYSVSTKRPFYDPELQEACISVRQSNRGIDGKPVLFYDRKSRSTEPPSKPTRQNSSPMKEIKEEKHPDVLAAIRSLGMVSVTGDQIDTAVGTVFPNGIAGVEPGHVIRGVFLHLKRSDTAQKM